MIEKKQHFVTTTTANEIIIIIKKKGNTRKKETVYAIHNFERTKCSIETDIPLFKSLFIASIFVNERT